MKRLAYSVTVVMVAIVAQTSAQAQEQPQDQFLGEATVNVIEVPVRVFDRHTGEEVTGLTAADFRILENGTEQGITNFAEIRIPAAADEGAAPTEVEVTKPLEIVYFLDLYLMYKVDRDRVVDALDEHYSGGVPDGEYVSVVVFDGSLATYVNRSDDRREIQDAVDEIRYTPANGIKQAITLTDALSEGPVSGERGLDFYERRQRSNEFMFELENRVDRVGAALSATMARYARAEGRRVIVAFTPGYPKSSWSPTYTPVDYLNNSARYPTEFLWEEVANEASDLGFTVYTIDSSGLNSPVASDVEIGVTDALRNGYVDDNLFQTQGGARIEGPDGGGLDDDTFAQEAAAVGDVNPGSQNLGQWLERTRKDLLLSATKSTGGEALFDDQVAKAIETMRSHLSHYYSLAYTAGHAGDGETYEIDVKLPDHPRYRLVHRTGYVDQPTATRAAQRIRSEMLFGGDANPLGVQVEIGQHGSDFKLGSTKSKRIQVPLDVKIPYARIEMVPRGDIYWGKVVITFFNEDQAGNQSELASFEQPITVEADLYDEAVRRGYFSYKATIQVDGGQQNVYVGIEDMIGGRTSIMPQTLEY